MLVKPETQLVTQAPFWKNPALHLQTPFNEYDPSGQLTTHLLSKRLNPVKQLLHLS